MIVAGGPGEDVDAAIAKSNETKMLDLISAFAEQNVDPNRPKWLVSICTGAGFLATCGLFGGKTVTSHWAYLDQLRAICQKYSMPATTVVRERWVNAGVLDGGVKLVTSGGVSCGIDCTLWLLSEIGGAKGMDLANSVALVMDYDWKYPRPNITFGQLV
jgi:transcriptional regulator GlxA family with amidase domain